MATSSLTGLLGVQDSSVSNGMGFNPMNAGTSGNVQSGMGQVQQVASVIGNAVDAINSAVGNGNTMKKGGAVKGAKVSTHKKSKKASTW
jgi:hypothetical protein